MMDEGDYYRTRQGRSPIGMIAALVFLAFISGAALSTYAIRHWDKVAKIVRPEPAAVLPQAIPLPAPQSRPAAVQVAAPVAADPALSDRVDTIEEQVETIDKRATAASSDADRAEGMLAAIAARRALDRGLPLGYLEGLLRQHFGGTEPQAVATIIGAAQRPITLIQLQDGVAAIAPTLEVPANAPGFWSGFRREIGSLFVIRRADQPSPLPGDRQARVDHALDQGQVDVAMAEVARMPGSAKAADWMDKARRYVMARNALDRIEAAALLRPGPPPQPVVAPNPTAG